MKLVFRRIESLPRLSWCAEIRAGSQDVIVYHGNWVETRADRFSEGAWNGPFEQGDFDFADTLVGSGGLFREGQLIFSPPTDISNWLATLRADDTLFVSNSLVFVLAIAGDKPASNYPCYFFDVLHSRRLGLGREPTLMPTHKGNQISLHPWENFRVNPDLSIQNLSRTRSVEFQTYDEYRRLLDTTVRSVLENAAHADRGRPFRPIAAISQGYDSPAAAVLMAKAGCREALTFHVQPFNRDGYDDNGEDIARCLGMKARIYGWTDYNKLSSLADAEFCASATAGIGAPLILAERQLGGGILSSGRPGDNVWGTGELDNLPDLLAPSVQTNPSGSLVEFRLRAGYLNFAIPYIGAVHRDSIQKITLSAEMKPWWVEGDYNRPIPRRMIEEAGVPRSAFGQQKLVGNSRDPVAMPEVSRKDFEVFLADLQIPAAIRHNRLPVWEYRKVPLDILYALSSTLPDRKKRLHRWLLPLTLRSDRRAFSSVPTKDLYLFHWGFERIKSRYSFD